VDINSLPAGARALVDANIFIYYLGGLSADCKTFLRRVALREIEAHLTTIIVAEVLHRRMMAEAITKGLITPGQVLKKLKANPAAIPLLTDYITETEKLLRLPLPPKLLPRISLPVTTCAAAMAASSTIRSISPAPPASASSTSSLTTPTSAACPRFRCGSRPTFDGPLPDCHLSHGASPTRRSRPANRGSAGNPSERKSILRSGANC